MAIAPPTFVADELVTAAKMNLLPKGVLGRAQAVAAQAGIATNADLTSLTVTVTVAANRMIVVSGYSVCQHSVAGGALDLRIMESSTVLQEARAIAPNTVHLEFLAPRVYLTPSVGSHTYKLNLVNEGGGGTVASQASASRPAQIYVVDLGGV